MRQPSTIYSIGPGYRRTSIVLVAVIAISSVAALVLTSFDLKVEMWLAIINAFLLIGTFIRYSLQRHRNWFEPIFISLVVLFGMYVTRPIALFLQDGPAFYKSYRMDIHYVHAMALVLVAALTFIVVYGIVGSSARLQSHAADSDWNATMVVRCALFFALLSMGLYSVFVQQAGGLGTILSGRTSIGISTYDRSSAYFWSAPLLLFPAALSIFLVYLRNPTHKLLLLTVLVQAPQIILAAATGARIELLPVGIAYFAAYYLFHQRSPPSGAMLISFYLAVTVGIGFFVQIRDAGSAARSQWLSVLTHSLMSPLKQFGYVFWDGNSNDMFQSLAIELNVVPSRLPFAPFDYVYRIVAKVIPSVLWAGKPVSPEEHLAQIMFPIEALSTRASSSPGMVGYSYQLGGVIGIVLVFSIIAFVAKRVWLRYLQVPTSLHAIGMVAITLGFLPILFRGAIADSLSRMLFIVVPFCLISWAASITSPTRPSQGPFARTVRQIGRNSNPRKLQ